MQTKLFNSYFSSFLEMLKCKRLFLQYDGLAKTIPKILPNNLGDSTALSTRFSLTIYQILPYHSNCPVLGPRWYAGTLVHFVKSSGMTTAQNLLFDIIYIIIYIIFI